MAHNCNPSTHRELMEVKKQREQLMQDIGSVKSEVLSWKAKVEGLEGSNEALKNENYKLQVKIDLKLSLCVNLRNYQRFSSLGFALIYLMNTVPYSSLFLLYFFFSFQLYTLLVFCKTDNF